MTKTTLKSYFQTGDVPNESQFSELIDGIGQGAVVIAASNAPNSWKASSDYLCDGTADEVQINAALVAAGTTNKVVLSPGMFQITASIDVENSQKLEGCGLLLTRIDVVGAITAIDMTCGLAKVGGFYLISSGIQYLFTGIYIKGQHNQVYDVYGYYPLDFIKLAGGTYYSDIRGISAVYVERYGIHLALADAVYPNANIIKIKGFNGHAAAAGSIGIKIDGGSVNSFEGAVENFETNINNAGDMNKFVGYMEGATISDIVTSKPFYFYGTAGSRALVVSGDGEILDPYANGWGIYTDYSPVRPSWNQIKAVYPMGEGTGAILYDYSGNKANAAITGGAWVDGLYGPTIQLDKAASDLITIPNTVIDPAVAWTVAILWKAVTKDLYNNCLLQIRQADGNYIQILNDDLDANVSGYYKVTAYNGVDVEEADVMSMCTEDRWAWLFIGYDPVAGKLYSYDPVFASYNVVHDLTNTITTIDTIKINTGATAFKAIYQYIAIWNRLFSIAEARAIMNSQQPLFPWFAQVLKT